MYLLNVEPSNLVFLKTCNTEFDEIIITFANQNHRPLGDKVNFTLFINKWKWHIILENQERENVTKIWIFIIDKKSIKQIRETIIGYCY